MSIFDSIRAWTGLDQFALANVLFFAMVVLIWLVIAVLEQRDQRPLPPPSRGPERNGPISAFAPKFADGWICRGCWTSNRAQDVTCPRCGAAAVGLAPALRHRTEGDLTFSPVGALSGSQPSTSARPFEPTIASHLAGQRGRARRR